jgi:hypothetical protein
MQQCNLKIQGASGMLAGRIAALIVASTVIGSASASAQAPDPRAGASTPVQVVNTPDKPVPVTGTVTGEVKLTNSLVDVAVVNDVVNKPYMVSRLFNISGGRATGSIDFDIPDGMRLIVETISVSITLDAPGNAVMQYLTAVGGYSQFGHIPLQPQGTIIDSSGRPGTWIVGMQAITLRLDAQPGKDDEFTLYPTVSPVDGSGSASVAGYLVPIP